MKRFYRGKKKHHLRNLVISGILFLAIGACFYIGVQSVSVRTRQEQRKSLEDALRKAIVHCYVTEGQYPENLDYIKQQYGIQYDSQTYFVDYQIVGANIMPDLTIIEK